MKMRKVLLTTGLLLGVGVIIFIVVLSVIYNGVQNDKNAVYDEAIEQAFAETPINSVTSSSLFNGRQSYVVITGEDEEGNTLYVFVPQINSEEEEDAEIKYVQSDEGLTENEMLEQWESNCEECDLDSIQLGVLNNRYVWEIIYERQGRLYFQTFRFDNGELYDSISF
ncbi:Uncharacterized protein YpmB [Piscibacillus halophilus]|uniref:Uncharacterized protein YpmB n=2 Tax=Piscibacillus halophilus TaxID=571933 RepID=A0A1H8ZQW2_9BACI|nr:Uncharacterized protein YpmB [Piscibacillus halophilus]